MIQIEPARITDEGYPVEGEEPASMLGLDGDPDVEPTSPVAYHLVCFLADHELLVQGRLRVEVNFRCTRCAEKGRRVIEEPDFSCNLEVRDLSQSVDLTEEVREATLLAFPNYPVCRPDCRGLCGRCGVNLNREVCRCRPETDNRWGALDTMKIN